MSRKEMPPGREIAEMAKKMVREEGKVIQGMAGGKTVRFVGAKLDHLKKEVDVEAGAVIGILENEAPGDESGLPPGRYHLFAAKVNDKWEVYAESEGEVRGKAARVKVEQHTQEDRASLKGTFIEKGWCFRVCLIPCPICFRCLVSATVCF